jgi:hypothetical protein
MKKYVIVAPHADDEIIGCYELLLTGLVDSVIFGNSQACEEAILSSEHFGFNIKCLDDIETDITKIFLFPDPTYELHPEHRRLGSIGEELLRAGQAVVFYTTNMLAPYIHEVTQPLIKRKCLGTLYPKKNALWVYDYKYFLFEGYTKWIVQNDWLED